MLREPQHDILLTSTLMSKPVNLEKMRHSCSHVLAQAALQMFPEAKLAIGPPIDNGFYYDFDLPRTLIPEDLPILEEKMRAIVKENQKFKRYEEPVEKSIQFLRKIKQPYKVEMARDLKKDGAKVIRFYENIGADQKGKFVDMCEGPHLRSTGEIGAFKLTKIAGAYWRGDSKKPMLQRIYGICFNTRPELKAYQKQLEEAAKRDHRKLGAQLDLFSFHEEGPGFPFWHPKGVILWGELVKYWRELHQERGYQEIVTPIFLRKELWHKSGHWGHYKENMYFTEIDEEGYAAKPMNCPGGILLYKEKVHSYREFPLKVGELGLVHRHELSGVLHGLFRVRSFTQDDAHIYCTKAQIKNELKEVLDLFQVVYDKFGFEYRVELSTRPKKFIGKLETWDYAEKIMKEVMSELKMDYRINEGDGAFYGPKFDFHLADSIGRTWQCGTLQLDLSMPERFNMEYIDEKGEKQRPVMLHRTVYGALERFIGILIEHYAGAFPVWLAPVQVQIVPVSEKFLQFAEKMAGKFKKAGIRVEVDYSEESVGKKIRNAELMKVPYMLVVGEKEKKSDSLMVRQYGQKKQALMGVEEFMEKVRKETERRKN